MKHISILFLTPLIASSAWAEAKKYGGKKKGTKSVHNDYGSIPGTYTQGKYIVFYEYSDEDCKDLVAVHGNPLGVCQKATVSAADGPYAGDYWINFGGTNADTTFIFYQFFTDDLCNEAAEGTGPPSDIAIGNENWPARPACLSRGTYYKQFEVRDNMPYEYFEDGVLATIHKTKGDCKHGNLPFEFFFTKNNKCSAHFHGLPFSVGSIVTGGFAGKDLQGSCEGGNPMIRNFYSQDASCQSIANELSWDKDETCNVDGLTVLVSGTGYFNIVCV